MKSFGEEFKRLRKMSRVTLREIGEYVGKSIGYLSDVEHDRKGPPDLDTVEKIERFLGVKEGYLVNLAANIRKQTPMNVVERIKMRPKLSEVLLRADEAFDSDNGLDELLDVIRSLEEKRRRKE